MSYKLHSYIIENNILIQDINSIFNKLVISLIDNKEINKFENDILVMNLKLNNILNLMNNNIYLLKTAK